MMKLADTMQTPAFLNKFESAAGACIGSLPIHFLTAGKSEKDTGSLHWLVADPACQCC